MESSDGDMGLGGVSARIAKMLQKLNQINRVSTIPLHLHILELSLDIWRNASMGLLAWASLLQSIQNDCGIDCGIW